MKSLKLFFGGLLSIAFCTIPVSCSQEDTATSESNQAYDVTLNLAAFEESSSSTRSVGIEDSEIKHIRYIVYSDADNIVLSGRLSDGTLNNPIRLRLTKGDYRIAVFASDNTIEEYPDNSSGYTKPSVLYYSNKDLYWANYSFSLEDSAKVETITLKRWVSRILIGLDDLNSIPSDIEYVTAALVRNDLLLYPGYRIFYDGKTEFSINSAGILHPKYFNFIEKNNFSAHNANNPFSLLIPQTKNISVEGLAPGAQAGSLDIYLLGLKSKDELDSEKNGGYINLENISYTRKLTRNAVFEGGTSYKITGRLFDTNGFSVSLDDRWENTTNEEF